MRLLLLLITISVSSPAVVEWRPNKSFNLPMNFRDHKLPCSKQTVVFPQTVPESVKMESDISVKEFILPAYGELLFEDATIYFGENGHENCTDARTAYYTPKSESSWADPDVWSSTKFNEATPDAERVPCYDDQVVFPTGSQFTVYLPNQLQTIRKLTISGREYSVREFRNFIIFNYNSEGQKFLMNDYFQIGLLIGSDQSKCTKPAGCPCQNNVLKINCEEKVCPIPKCIDPIQPVGHCCKICGGYLILDMDTSFDMHDFQKNVAEVIDSYGKENLVYHIGLLADNKIQLVVVDNGEYTGTSAEAIHDIEYKLNNKGLQSFAHISGGPSSKAGMGAKIFFSMFFVVVLSMGAIYVFYYRTPRLPKLSYPEISIGRRSYEGIMSRFSRRSDSVVSLTSRRDSVRSGLGRGTAFRNPMYDSKRGRVEVAEPVEEE